MATQSGIVESVSNAPDGQVAAIRVLPLSACARCAAGQGCGAGLFSRLLRMGETVISLPVDKKVAAGQTVWLYLDERKITQQAWLWYGLPILGFLLGAALPVLLLQGYMVGSDWLSLLTGSFIMLVCWIVARRRSATLHPRVLTRSPC